MLFMRLLNIQMTWQILIDTVHQHYQHNRWALLECQSILGKVEEMSKTEKFCEIFDRNLAYPSLHTTLVSSFDDLIKA